MFGNNGIKRFVSLLAVLLLLCSIFTGCGNSNEESKIKEEPKVVEKQEVEAEKVSAENESESTEVAENQETKEVVENDEKTAEDLVEEAMAEFIMDGVYKVGTDIQPGLYKVDVTDEIMNMAYIDRSKSASMDFESIIANVIITNRGYVRIKESDAFVKVQGGKLSPADNLEKNIQTTLEDGIYLVGVDLEAGTYKVEVTDDIMNMGYVERLSDVSMDMDDIIANDLYENKGYVEVKSSDFAVGLQGVRLTKAE